MLVDHRAGCVGSAGEGGEAVAALAARGDEPPPILQHDQQILDDAVPERVGEDDAVAISGIAARIDHPDVPLGADLARAAVPDHSVRPEVVALAGHAHVAADGDDFALGIVGKLIGAEFDRRVAVGDGGGEGILSLPRLLRERDARRAQQQGQGRRANETKRLHNLGFGPAASVHATLEPIAPQAVPCNPRSERDARFASCHSFAYQFAAPDQESPAS
jgi:hypothetical protein